MDVISFSEAATANSRIEKVNANPDSSSGILTQPMVIATGQSVTIPAGRIAVLPNAVVNGEIVVDGELFIPSGATNNDIEAQLALKAPLVSPTFTGTPTINGTPVSLFGNGFKNHIIDGRFDFWYEGTSQTTRGYGSDTMWFNGSVGSTKTHTRQAFPTGGSFPDGKLMPMYYSRTVMDSVAGAENHVHKNQRLEDVTRLAGKTLTLSFYAKADANKNIAIEYEQFFGVGGSPSSPISAINTQKIAITTEWVKYSRTFTTPSIADKTLGTNGVHTSFSLVRFWFDAGSNFSTRAGNLGQQSGTFDIAMVQLEEGSVATDFEWNGTAVEKYRINRYFQIISWSDRKTATAAGQYLHASINFKTMRVTPTSFNLSQGSKVNSNYIAFSPLTNNSGRAEGNSADSGDCYIISAVEKLDARQ